MTHLLPVLSRFARGAFAGAIIAAGASLTPSAVHAEETTAKETLAVTRQGVAAHLAAHRAVIDLKLVKATSSSSVAELNGRMVFEVNGTPCEGFTVNFRFVTEVRDTKGKTRVTDLRTATFEGGKGENFEFLTQTFVNEALSEKTRGSAAREGDKVVVTLSEPAEKTLDLPGDIVFPTGHLVEMVYRAMVGARFDAVDLYDGSEGGEKIFPTAIAIGAEATGPDDFSNEPAADKPFLKGQRRWPVSVGYFNGAAGQDGEQTPVYEMRFLLYENGVSRDLVIDYGEFVLEGKVIELEELDKPSCDPAKAN